MDDWKNVITKRFEFEVDQNVNLGKCELICVDLKERNEHLFVYYNKKNEEFLISTVIDGKIVDSRSIGSLVEDGKNVSQFGRNLVGLHLYIDRKENRRYLLLLGQKMFRKYNLDEKKFVLSQNSTTLQKGIEKSILFQKDFFVTCGTDGIVNMYNCGNLLLHRSFNFGDESHCLTESRTHPNYLIAGGFGLTTDSRIRVWDVTNGDRILSDGFHKTHTNGVKGINTVVLFGNQEFVVTFSWDHDIFFWNLESGKLFYKVCRAHSNIVEHGIFGNSYKYMITTSGNDILITKLRNNEDKKDIRRTLNQDESSHFPIVGKIRKSEEEGGVGYINWMSYLTLCPKNKVRKVSKKYFITHSEKKVSFWDFVVEPTDGDLDSFEDNDLRERVEFIKDNFLLDCDLRFCCDLVKMFDVQFVTFGMKVSLFRWNFS